MLGACTNVYLTDKFGFGKVINVTRYKYSDALLPLFLGHCTR